MPAAYHLTCMKKINVQPELWDQPASLRPESDEATLYFERLLHDQGYTQVAGTDEVGRGCLAGPVVAAAVILPTDCNLHGLTDSKKLSAEQRRSLVPEIEQQALSFSIASVPPRVIDQINILQASLKAMALAVKGLDPGPSAVLVDGNQPIPLQLPQKTVVKGDSRSLSIAAASVIAKVHRDNLMEEYHKRYPEYQFARHKGYATAVHLDALRRYGPCPLHRMTFKGVKARD